MLQHDEDVAGTAGLTENAKTHCRWRDHRLRIAQGKVMVDSGCARGYKHAGFERCCVTTSANREFTTVSCNEAAAVKLNAASSSIVPRGGGGGDALLS